MKEIVKRLEIIKSSLSIEDAEIIELQADRLRLLSIDDNVREIVACIENGNFGQLSRMIEEYLAKYSGVAIYEDPTLQGLRIELRTFERMIQTLSDTKADYLRTIHEFNEEYNRRLGELIKRLLHLREEFLAKAAEQDGSQQEAYEEARADSASFEKEYEEYIKEPPVELTEEDREEIKKLYRQASCLCHPDKVEEKRKKQAEEIFKALGSAYEKGDKETVRKILEALQSGESFASDSDVLNDRILIEKKIEALKAEVARLKAEIEKIEDDDTFKTLHEIISFDDYFEHKKEELIAKIDRLESQECYSLS